MIKMLLTYKNQNTYKHEKSQPRQLPCRPYQSRDSTLSTVIDALSMTNDDQFLVLSTLLSDYSCVLISLTF